MAAFPPDLTRITRPCSTAQHYRCGGRVHTWPDDGEYVETVACQCGCGCNDHVPVTKPSVARMRRTRLTSASRIAAEPIR